MVVHDVLFHLAGSSNLSGVSKPKTRPSSCCGIVSSSHNSSSTVNSLMQTTSLRTKMDINIDNHVPAKVYTCGDALTGTVTITPQTAVPFDSIEIVLTGTVHARLPRTYQPLQIAHHILSLPMPIDEATYPTPRVLEANHLYVFRFHFVIPHQLTIGVCKHSKAPDVQAQHLRLPPSLGGKSWERDDMASDSTWIDYAIKARVLRHDMEHGVGRNTKVVEGVCKLLVLPTTAPDPALQPVPQKPDSARTADRVGRLYKHLAVKTIRKGAFGCCGFVSSKHGRLSVVAGDGVLAPVPAPIALRHDGGGSSSMVGAALTAPGHGTTARVHLHFEPAATDMPPPQITDITAKLSVHTLFCNTGTDKLPDRGDWLGYDGGAPLDLRSQYTQSVTLPLPAGAVQTLIKAFRWQGSADDGTMTGPDCNDDSSKTTPDVRLSFSGSLDIPIDIPLHAKMFLPTFHSCCVSRVYILRLAIAVAPGSQTSSLSSMSQRSSASRSSTHIKVAVPVQVVMAPPRKRSGNLTDLEGPDKTSLPTYEEALEEPASAASDDDVLPGVLAMPHQQHQGTGQLPEYRR